MKIYLNWQDQYMAILLGVETAIDGYFRDHKDLKDKEVIIILERLIYNSTKKVRKYGRQKKI